MKLPNTISGVMKFLSAFLIVSCFLHSSVQAQTSKKAKNAYEKAQKAFEEKDYVKTIEHYQVAIKEETSMDNPDFNFTAQILETIGSWFVGFNEYLANSSEYYYLAGIHYGRAGMLEKSSSSFQIANQLYDSILKYDAKLVEPDSGATESVYFPIYKIVRTSGDTTWFLLEAGKNQGIQTGQSGWILTRAASGSDRGNREFGKYKVHEANNATSLCWAIASGEGKGIELLDGDNVLVNVPIDPDTYRGLLFDLSILNIQFVDGFHIPVVNYHQICNMSKPESEAVVIAIYRNIIYNTANELYDPEDPDQTMTDTMKGGIFQGKNIWEAMMSCTDDDVRLFLEFVRSFPAKYMGIEYRIDETFATWVINNTPLPSESPELLTHKFLSISDIDSMRSWVDIHMPLIRSGALEFGKINAHIYMLSADSSFDLAQSLSLLMVDVSITVQQDSFKLEFMNAYGQVLIAQEKYDDAIEAFKEVLNLDPENGNTHWYLGNAYLSNEEFKRAQTEYEFIMKTYPNWAGGHGMYGWTLLKKGDFPGAYDYCKKAYELDEFNTTYIMNYAHANLLMDKHELARELYMKCLENMTYVSSFEDGVMEDFQYFIDKYWKPELVRKERDFLQGEWNRHYKFKVMASEAYEKGKTLQDEEKYEEAGALFDKAIALEQKGEAVRYDWLRSYYRWAAFQYYKNQDYRSSLDRYRNSWDVSRMHLNNLEYEISDLENIGNMYSWMDNDLQLDMYRKMQYAAQRKLQNKTRSNNLFVISMGNNSFGDFGYSYAEKDASVLAKKIETQAKLVFDKSSVQIITGNNATEATVRKAFEEVISNSRPGDCFIFYYSGYCPKNTNGQMVFGKDTLSNKHLLGWLSLMQADKKLILMDAANASLIKQYTEQKETSDILFNNENLTFILSDGRVELPNDSSGLFTSFLINGMAGKAAADWGNRFSIESEDGVQNLAQVTAKGLEGYMYGKMSKENMQFELKSYSYGADFPIAFVTSNMNSGIDTIPPMIYITGVSDQTGHRGGKSKTLTNQGGNIYGQALDISGISEIKVNNESIDFSQNGKFTLTSEFVKRWSKVVVKAKDQNGLWGSDSFYLNTQSGEMSPSQDQTFDQGAPTNYALIFATNDYDHWSDLKNPVNDAMAIGEILEHDYGFKVKIIKDATLSEMRNTFMEYFSKPYGSKDQLFVFFAGHGFHDTYLGGQIVCKDSKLKDDDPSLSTYLTFEWVKSGLNNIYRCKHVMLTMDVCYGGAGFDQVYAPPYGSYSIDDIKKQPGKFYEESFEYKTRLYLTSGDSTYVSDGSGTHSPFAEKFIGTLNSKGKEKGGVITLIDFAGNMRFTEQGKQKIRYGSFGDSHADGDFVFLYKGSNLKMNVSDVSAGGAFGK